MILLFPVWALTVFVGKTRATKDTLAIDYSVLPVDDFGPLADVSRFYSRTHGGLSLGEAVYRWGQCSNSRLASPTYSTEFSFVPPAAAMTSDRSKPI